MVEDTAAVPATGPLCGEGGCHGTTPDRAGSDPLPIRRGQGNRWSPWSYWTGEEVCVQPSVSSFVLLNKGESSFEERI